MRMSVSESRDTNASMCSPGCAMRHDPVGDGLQFVDAAHAAVPPIVSAFTRKRRLTVADRHALAVLAARARVAHREVVAQQVDVAQHLRTVADQVAFAQRLGDLTVLDQVGLGHAEHEVAGGRVDAAAAELGDVHAVIGAADDVVGILGAVEHVGVGHPHHRQVHVALSPAVAGLLAALLAGPQVVPHVVGEHTVLDEHVVLARVAFVVDADRAPLAAHRAVVDQRDERRGDAARPACRGRRCRPWR